MSTGAPAAGDLARRPRRLADVPAVIAYELARLAPADPQGLAGVRIQPAATDGRVLIEAMGETMAAAIEADGTAAQAVTLPRAALLSLRRRHPEADRLTVDDQAPLVRLQTLSDAAAVAIACPQAPALPALPSLPPAGAGGTPRGPLLMDPGLLGRAIEALQRIGGGPVELARVDGHPSIGLALRPCPGREIGGAVWVCRCLLRDGAALG